MSTQPLPAALGVKALIFDVFGTLVDWRSSVARQAQEMLEPLQLQTDWPQFADDWRAQYQPAMQEVRSGRMGFVPLDVLHRRNLEVVLAQRGWQTVPESIKAQLNLAWHRLEAWLDVNAGLRAMREHYLLAPCSNGHIALMVNLARHNGWHWDAITGAEIAGDYKPQPIVYRRSCKALGLEPSQVMMVAAHSSDLQAAAACGLRTGFIPRPDEYGPGQGESAPACAVDVVFDAEWRAHPPT